MKVYQTWILYAALGVLLLFSGLYALHRATRQSADERLSSDQKEERRVHSVRGQQGAGRYSAGRGELGRNRERNPERHSGRSEYLKSKSTEGLKGAPEGRPEQGALSGYGSREVELNTEDAISDYRDEVSEQLRELTYQPDFLENRDEVFEQLAQLTPEERRLAMRERAKENRETLLNFENNLSENQRWQRERLQRTERLLRILNRTRQQQDDPEHGEASRNLYQEVLSLLEQAPVMEEEIFRSQLREISKQNGMLLRAQMPGGFEPISAEGDQ